MRTYQLTIHAMLIAVATYFASNISATINHGIGPRPISIHLEEMKDTEKGGNERYGDGR